VGRGCLKPDEVRLLAKAEESFWWHRGRQRIVRRLLDRFVSPGARVLDIGCGPGGTTLAYAPGRDVLATDSSPESLRWARQRGLTVAAMDASRLAVAPQSVDAVVALDILEHVHDDAAVVREAYRTLRPGGVLVLTVPAYQFLWSNHDEAVGHLRRYTRRPLVKMVQESGFQITVGEYTMAAILPAAIVVRLAERLRPPVAEPKAKFTPLPRLVNAVLERIVGLGPIPVPLVPVPFGLSIVIVGRRLHDPPGDGAKADG
jgi:SAM-dependent methyltransferase